MSVSKLPKKDDLDVNTSSRKKGESILDMMYTLQAMHVDIFVVRDTSTRAR